MTEHLSAIMRVMQHAARKASRKLLRDFGEVEHLQIARKGPADFVSRADKQSEETIFENLKRDRPGYCFLMEEAGEVLGSDKTHRFIIDPLDGTTNFLHGIPHFSISIALEREIDGQPRETVADHNQPIDVFALLCDHGFGQDTICDVFLFCRLEILIPLETSIRFKNRQIAYRFD